MRVAVCGAVFARAVEVLGLESVAERPDLALVDLDDVAAATDAATVSPDVPRIVLAGPQSGLLLRAAGSSVAIAPSADPAAIGPLVASLAPPPTRSATRVIVVTGVGGGIGRTLLTVNLAIRLAARTTVLVIDATGTGVAAWWLGLSPAPWSDLEGLVDELTTEHLAVVAAERQRIRLLGGSGSMPTAALLAASVRQGRSLADVVLVDAPSLLDDRTRAIMVDADHVLVVASDTTPTAWPLDGVSEERISVIASRSRVHRLGEHAVFRALPDDPGAVRAASRGPSAVSGALGRAYDELAELLALDLA